MCPSDSENQLNAEAAATPTTEVHLSLAKEIEKFASEMGADLAETFYAFKQFALGSKDPNAQPGDVADLNAGADVTGEQRVEADGTQVEPEGDDDKDDKGDVVD